MGLAIFQKSFINSFFGIINYSVAVVSSPYQQCIFSIEYSPHFEWIPQVLFDFVELVICYRCMPSIWRSEAQEPLIVL